MDHVVRRNHRATFSKNKIAVLLKVRLFRRIRASVFFDAMFFVSLCVFLLRVVSLFAFSLCVFLLHASWLLVSLLPFHSPPLYLQNVFTFIKCKDNVIIMMMFPIRQGFFTASCVKLFLFYKMTFQHFCIILELLCNTSLDSLSSL